MRRREPEDLAQLSTKRPYCRVAGKIGVSAHTKALRESLVARDSTNCWICKKWMPRQDRTIDHILPISLNGQSTLDNLKLAHARCNSFRSSKVHLSAEQIVRQMERRAERDRARAHRSYLRAKWKESERLKAKNNESAATPTISNPTLIMR